MSSVSACGTCRIGCIRSVNMGWRAENAARSLIVDSFDGCVPLLPPAGRDCVVNARCGASASSCLSISFAYCLSA